MSQDFAQILTVAIYFFVSSPWILLSAGTLQPLR